jgi:hypothetical protein
MMDAEHPPQIVFMLAISALANGVWYGLVGLAIWHLLRRKTFPPDSSIVLQLGDQAC